MIYAAAKVVLFDPAIPEKLLLIYREINQSGGYEAAGGRLEVDFESKTAENYEECAVREIKEEVGVDIKLSNYLGSYSFFWDLKENTVSSCVVFLGEIISGAIHNNNLDKQELGLEPKWVTIHEVIHDLLPVRYNHIGLKPLLVKAINIIKAASSKKSSPEQIFTS